MFSQAGRCPFILAEIRQGRSRDHDGVLPTIDDTGPLYIDGIPGVLNHYQGLIDAVRIYDKALTEQEIQDVAD